MMTTAATRRPATNPFARVVGAPTTRAPRATLQSAPLPKPPQEPGAPSSQSDTRAAVERWRNYSTAPVAPTATTAYEAPVGLPCASPSVQPISQEHKGDAPPSRATSNPPMGLSRRFTGCLPSRPAAVVATNPSVPVSAPSVAGPSAQIRVESSIEPTDASVQSPRDPPSATPISAPLGGSFMQDSILELSSDRLLRTFSTSSLEATTAPTLPLSSLPLSSPLRPPLPTTTTTTAAQAPASAHTLATEPTDYADALAAALADAARQRALVSRLVSIVAAQCPSCCANVVAALTGAASTLPPPSVGSAGPIATLMATPQHNHFHLTVDTRDGQTERQRPNATYVRRAAFGVASHKRLRKAKPVARA